MLQLLQADPWFETPARRRHAPPASAGESSAGALARELRTDTPSLAYLADGLLVAGRYNVPLLLTGETGTGKTRLARLIHQHSIRKARPFVTVACGAVSSALLESEFFGHVQGAFTGAIKQRIGRFAAAGYGTVLLDEIDALPLERQVSLLRVIETGEFEPVGSEQTQFCRARIMATSNVGLEEAISKGTFRQDLYYRLSGLSFHLPPLRERLQDIAPLAAFFVGQFCVKYGKPPVRLHDSLTALQDFAWPGNIRQLENVVHEAVLRCQGAQILPEHLPPLIVAKCQSVWSGHEPNGERSSERPQEDESG